VYPIGALYVCPISVGGRDSVGQYFPEDTWVYIYVYIDKGECVYGVEEAAAWLV